MRAAPEFAHLRAAEARISAYVHHTPILTCATLDRISGARLFFKVRELSKGGIV